MAARGGLSKWPALPEHVVADVEHFGAALLSAADFDRIAKLASLLLLPFANEDVAVVTGAYFVTNELVPAALVSIFIYCGMVGSDLALYGIGSGARHLPWLGRFVDRGAARLIGSTIQEMFELVALCRVTPGAEFVVFVACGWQRVPLRRFVPAILLISALYLPIILYLSVIFGDALDDHFGIWAWFVVFVGVVAAGYARGRVFRLDHRVPVTGDMSSTP